PECHCIFGTDFIEQLLRCPGYLLAHLAVQSGSSPCEFQQYSQGYRRVLNVDGCVLLSDPVLINNKIVAAKIGNKVSVGILYQQLEANHASRRIEMDLRFLLALRAVE